MSRRAVDWIAAVRILLFAGLLILGIFLPLPALEGVPLCFYYARFGRLCPGCGMTRAFFHIMQGDVPGAFALNPVFTTLYFPIMLILLYCVLGYYRPRRYNMWVVITLLFLFTVTFGIWGFYFR